MSYQIIQAIGAELKPTYFRQAIRNLESIEHETDLESDLVENSEEAMEFSE